MNEDILGPEQIQEIENRLADALQPFVGKTHDDDTKKAMIASLNGVLQPVTEQRAAERMKQVTIETVDKGDDSITATVSMPRWLAEWYGIENAMEGEFDK